MNIGELLPNKNQKTAVAAMPEILETCPEALLLIAGNGPEKQNLEKQIIQSGLQDHIKLLGYTIKTGSYVKACDALISCSHREGMPLNIMEAMLCGKPVVASHNRGHDELVKDGITGYLVNPDDSKEYAEKAVLAVRQDSSLGEAAIKAVVPYTDYSVREELEEIYQCIM